MFTIGVLLCTLVFGLLAGWSLALLEFRGKGSVFSGMLLLLVVSFQLLLVPLYVLIVRYYGLADSYLGMILPFAINSTAVFIFRQFFLQIPKDLFEAARIDGASELLLLWKIGIPMARPAILSAALITFIGPWNEFMWPFLITKEQELQPFAVSLSNYMNEHRRARRQPGRLGARRRRGAGLAGGLAVRHLPEALHVHGCLVRREGVAVPENTVPYRLTRVGVVMRPNLDDPFEAMGVLNPASGRTPDGRLHLLPRLVAAGNVSRVGLAEVVIEDGVPVGVERRGVVLAPGRGLGAGREQRRRRGSAHHLDPALGLHVMTYVAFGPLGPRPALAVSEDLVTWRRLGPIQWQYQPDLDTDLCMFPNKDTVWFPEPLHDAQGREVLAMLHRPMWDLSWIRPGETTYLPAGRHRPAPGDLAVDGAARRGPCGPGRSGAPTRPSVHRDVRVPVRGAQDRRGSASAARARGLAGAAPRRDRLTCPEGFDPTTQQVNYAAGAMILDAEDPSRILARTAEPLLVAETEEERVGVVNNVVFPTAIEEVDGQRFVFYGMADSQIGVARLDAV